MGAKGAVGAGSVSKKPFCSDERRGAAGVGCIGEGSFFSVVKNCLIRDSFKLPVEEINCSCIMLSLASNTPHTGRGVAPINSEEMSVAERRYAPIIAQNKSR